jgi:type II secretion system protein L
MPTLRVLLNAAPDPGRAVAWALFDADENVVQSGKSAPNAWPAAERREAVLAASCVRIVGLGLPPMSADRVASAAAFALEDQLAGPAEEQHIAVSPQRSDGTVEAIVANRELVAQVAENFDRVLAEPALAPRPAPQHWRWYASGAGGGFVRKPDGSAFATGEERGVPAELNLALAHALRAGSGPVHVDLAFAADKTTSEAAQPAGVSFVRVGAWRWDAAGKTAWESATDLCQGEFARTVPDIARPSSRLFRIAAAVAALAIMLHVAASVGDWAYVRFDDWRAKSALASIAHEIGVASTTDPAMEIAGRYAAARHRAGLAAPTDALPMLARAAPALATLPAGVLKSATYADGHWTFDLAKSENVTSGLESQLASAGLTSLAAVNAAGTRIRVSLAVGAQ